MTSTSFSFLICSERSGSNLLLNILNNHPAVCAPPPSHLFRLFATNAANYGDLTKDSNWEILLRDFVEAFQHQLGKWQSETSASMLLRSCQSRHVLEPVRVMYAMEALQSGATHIFVKENHTARFAPDLLGYFGTARFIHMTRDPRDVAASYLATDGIPGGVERAISVWQADQNHAEELINAGGFSQLICRLRYEDLIADAPATLSGLMSHLDLEFEEGMLSFHTSRQVQENAERVSAWNNLSQPIMRSNSGKFAQKLKKQEIEYIELACFELMDTYGYARAVVERCPNQDARSRRIEALRPELREGRYEVVDATERATRDRRHSIIETVTSRRLR